MGAANNLGRQFDTGGLDPRQVQDLMRFVHETYAHKPDRPTHESEYCAHCRGEVRVGPETIRPVKIQRNPAYDPGHRPLSEYAPDREKDPVGYHEAFKAHNFEGDATHVAEFEYAHGKPWRTVVGYDEHTGRKSVWMD